MIANADMAVLRGDFDGALSILKAIGPAQAYYTQAREAMAAIYLNHRKVVIGEGEREKERKKKGEREKERKRREREEKRREREREKERKKRIKKDAHSHTPSLSSPQNQAHVHGVLPRAGGADNSAHACILLATPT